MAQRAAPQEPATVLAHEQRLHEVLAWIADAVHVEHSGSTLWDHLIGTYEILRNWGTEPEVQLGGLAHSIYATQYFRRPIVSDAARAATAAAIGARAERIAHAFCHLDRQALREALLPALGASVAIARHSSGRLRVSGALLRALQLVDMANEIEQVQRPFLPQRPWLAWASARFAAIGFTPSRFAQRLTISVEDEACLSRHYRAASSAVAAPPRRRALRACITAVPRCAEPRILLAAMQLEQRDFGVAYLNASLGCADLRAWGAAWDNRLPYSAWELLASQVMEAARGVNSVPPLIARQCLDRLRAPA